MIIVCRITGSLLLSLVFLMRPCRGGGGSHVTRLNFKMSCVGVYKCLSLIVGFAITVAIWLREVVSCRDFIFLCCRYFLGDVACRNLPWEGSLIRPLALRTPYNEYCSIFFCQISELSCIFENGYSNL